MILEEETTPGEEEREAGRGEEEGLRKGLRRKGRGLEGLLGLALREMEEEKQEVAAMDDMVCLCEKKWLF